MIFAQVVKIKKYPRCYQSLSVEFEESLMEFISLLYFSETPPDIGICRQQL